MVTPRPPSEKSVYIVLRKLKKRFAIFPSPAGMSLTKLSLAGNNLIIPAQREFGKWHPGWGGGVRAGKSINFFYSVGLTRCLCLSLSISVRSCRHCRHLSRLSSVSVSYSSAVRVSLCLFRRNCRSLLACSQCPSLSVPFVLVGLCRVSLFLHACLWVTEVIAMIKVVSLGDIKLVFCFISLRNQTDPTL